MQPFTTSCSRATLLGATARSSYTSPVPPSHSTAVGGAWITCAGSVSPWNTHLGSEEYEPDARAFEEATCLRATECADDSLERRDLGSYGSIMSFIPYLGLDPATATLADVRARFNPYLYGHTIEVVVKGRSRYEAKKVSASAVDS